MALTARNRRFASLTAYPDGLGMGVKQMSVLLPDARSLAATSCSCMMAPSDSDRICRRQVALAENACAS